MEFSNQIVFSGQLTAQIIHSDGSRDEVKDLGTRRFTMKQLKTWVLILLLAGVALVAIKHFLVAGVVTTAGVNYMAADFLNSSASHIQNFNQHDCGTGTTAPAIGDTTLQTPAGSARSVGTQSNPSANIYKTIGTITPGSALAITEWGLFSAASTGTMWDHRTFAAINVGSTDSIQFTYQLTITAGG